jgi:predicted esterase
MHSGDATSRREFIADFAAAGTGLACSPSLSAMDGSARLAARLRPPTGTVSLGLTPLGLNDTRDGFLLVPSGYDAARPWPLVLALHCAGITHAGPLNFFGPYAAERGFVLLAVDSIGRTWDAIRGSYGADVAFINRALQTVFDRAVVDPARLIIEGFSDGASYALGLGRANGDLFRRAVAFSPGFIPRPTTPDTGRPEIFISHGRQDPVLPIDAASRRIVSTLRRDGYDVTYLEYDGAHSVLPAVAADAMDWMLR